MSGPTCTGRGRVGFISGLLGREPLMRVRAFDQNPDHRRDSGVMPGVPFVAMAGLASLDYGVQDHLAFLPACNA